MRKGGRKEKGREVADAHNFLNLPSPPGPSTLREVSVCDGVDRACCCVGARRVAPCEIVSKQYPVLKISAILGNSTRKIGADTVFRKKAER